MLNYFKPRWRKLNSKDIRWSEGAYCDSYSEAFKATTDIIENWKANDLEFQVAQTSIEFLENGKVTTETYFKVENPHAKETTNIV